MTKSQPTAMKIVIVNDRATDMPGVGSASVPVVKWLDVCHEDHVGIHYDEYRETSRWQHADRKRKYHVMVWKHRSVTSYSLGYFNTVEAAIVAAKNRITPTPVAAPTGK